MTPSRPLLLALAALIVTGCTDVLGLGTCEPTRPAASGGELALVATMPNQELVVDDRGDQIQAEAVELWVASIEARAGGEVMAERAGGYITLQDRCEGRSARLGTLMELPRRPDSVVVRLGPRPGAATAGKLRPGASVAVAATFQPIVADSTQRFGAVVLNFAFNRALRLPVDEAERIDLDRGARMRLVLDPTDWLVDPATNRIAPVGTLSSDPIAPDGPATEALWERLRESARLQSY